MSYLKTKLYFFKEHVPSFIFGSSLCRIAVKLGLVVSACTAGHKPPDMTAKHHDFASPGASDPPRLTLYHPSIWYCRSVFADATLPGAWQSFQHLWSPSRVVCFLCPNTNYA